ncbi:MAG: T9SS type A sorting domain-containing protein [Lentimicrobium sp.]|jgi:hypothetical protein|nr:T9SS type A sorting domain-containing protein [Lentimicrobium sp.]
MKKTILFVLLLAISLSNINAQTWPKVYINPNGYTNASSAFQVYDNGITVLSNYFSNAGLVYAGWLFKTDINGEIIWERTLGSLTDYLSWFNMMQVTRDSGLVIALSTRYADLYPFGIFADAAFMKLNACGQLDWCNIINEPGIDNFGQDVAETYDGYVGLYNNYHPGGPPPHSNENPTSLIKFDFNGQIQWRLNYDDKLLDVEDWWDILVLKDSTYLVTGYTDYYDSIQSWWYRKPIKVNVGQDGNILDYQILYKDVDSIDSALDFFTIESAGGRLYSAGVTNSPKKSLRKQFLSEENPQFFSLSDSISYAYSLSWMQDSSIVIAGSMQNYDRWYEKRVEVQIVDTMGNILHSRRLLDDYTGPYYFVSTTHDNKILATGSAEENPYGPMHNTMLFKLTPTLEDDVFDPTPHVYDYACPGGVAPHDTIGMEECDIVVSAEHLATLPDVAVMEVYPNPVKDQFYIRLPEFIALRNSNKGLSTALYQSNYQQQSRLQVFDLSGRFVTEQKLTQGQLLAEFDTSNWAPGMYLLRLVYKDKTVGSAKVVK